MKRDSDDLGFDDAWKKGIVEQEADSKEQKPVKVHEKPVFRGQRNIVEDRKSMVIPAKKSTSVEKKGSRCRRISFVQRRRRVRCSMVSIEMEKRPRRGRREPDVDDIYHLARRFDRRVC